MKIGGLLNSEIPDLHIYTIKTLLIGWISIKTVFFLVPKTVLVEDLLHFENECISLEVSYVYGKTDLFYKSVFSSFQSAGYRLIYYVFLSLCYSWPSFDRTSPKLSRSSACRCGCRRTIWVRKNMKKVSFLS